MQMNLKSCHLDSFWEPLMKSRANLWLQDLICIYMVFIKMWFSTNNFGMSGRVEIFSWLLSPVPVISSVSDYYLERMISKGHL